MQQSWGRNPGLAAVRAQALPNVQSPVGPPWRSQAWLLVAIIILRNEQAYGSLPLALGHEEVSVAREECPFSSLPSPAANQNSHITPLHPPVRDLNPLPVCRHHGNNLDF